MWDSIKATLSAEFSDLADPGDLTSFLVRIVLAATLSAVVGYDRERQGSTAGLRTHMLVGVGAALLVITAEQSGMDQDDVSRVIQGIFAGIGFLGAGAIIKQRDKDEVRGLTTAATIWTTAAIGIAAGLGREATAIITTAFVFGILTVLLRLERKSSPQTGNERDGYKKSESQNGSRPSPG